MMRTEAMASDKERYFSAFPALTESYPLFRGPVHPLQAPVGGRLADTPSLFITGEVSATLTTAESYYDPVTGGHYCTSSPLEPRPRHCGSGQPRSPGVRRANGKKRAKALKSAPPIPQQHPASRKFPTHHHQRHIGASTPPPSSPSRNDSQVTAHHRQQFSSHRKHDHSSPQLNNNTTKGHLSSNKSPQLSKKTSTTSTPQGNKYKQHKQSPTLGYNRRHASSRNHRNTGNQYHSDDSGKGTRSRGGRRRGAGSALKRAKLEAKPWKRLKDSDYDDDDYDDLFADGRFSARYQSSILGTPLSMLLPSRSSNAKSRFAGTLFESAQDDPSCSADPNPLPEGFISRSEYPDLDLSCLTLHDLDDDGSDNDAATAGEPKLQHGSVPGLVEDWVVGGGDDDNIKGGLSEKANVCTEPDNPRSCSEEMKEQKQDTIDENTGEISIFAGPHSGIWGPSSGYGGWSTSGLSSVQEQKEPTSSELIPSIVISEERLSARQVARRQLRCSHARWDYDVSLDTQALGGSQLSAEALAFLGPQAAALLFDWTSYEREAWCCEPDDPCQAHAEDICTFYTRSVDPQMGVKRREVTQCKSTACTFAPPVSSDELPGTAVKELLSTALTGETGLLDMTKSSALVGKDAEGNDPIGGEKSGCATQSAGALPDKEGELCWCSYCSRHDEEDATAEAHACSRCGTALDMPAVMYAPGYDGDYLYRGPEDGGS